MRKRKQNTNTKKTNTNKTRKHRQNKNGKKKKKKDLGQIISTELSTDDYSQASSHYRLPRDLLPAAFRPWAGSVLIMQPGRSCGLLRSAHIDARLSAGARST